jgi:NO-binding membrane sensor protein with MHYT domain/signal transduction histidine kinase
MVMTGTHDTVLVIVSVLIAVLASFTALSLATRMRESGGWLRRAWLAAAATALGGGIWSTHFVGMLALRMPGMTMRYDPIVTLSSLAIALGSTAAAFAVLNGRAAAPGRAMTAWLLIGLGVVVMHFVGMAAIRVDAIVGYDPTRLIAFVAIALGATGGAVWLAGRDWALAQRLVAAVLLGTAIAAMHYAGMRAATFTARAIVPAGASTGGLTQIYLGILISFVTVTILLLALGTARLEKILQGFTRREARIALRLQIADILRTQDTETGLFDIAAVMGTHFGVSRAGYGQLDPVQDMFDFDVCWTDGIAAPLLGRFPAESFGTKLVAQLNSGQTLAISDLFDHPLSDEPLTRETARVVDTRAILVVPFVRAGRLRSIVFLSDSRPRAWRREDITFMEELAERTRLVVERALADAQLRELNATLEARVEARTRELRLAEEALVQSQKLEAIGQLVSGMSHDFNNVLAAVIGAFELLRRRPDQVDRVVKFADAGLEAARRGSRLTTQLMAFARSQQIELKPLLACEVIRPLHDMLSRTLGVAIRLEFLLDPDPVPVLADATQIEMMVLNLAINARDAMPNGGTLQVSTALRHVTGDHELKDGDYVEIAVRDTGTGMDAVTLRRAMEPFFTTKPIGSGTGLGLAQVYGTARQLGGTARLASVLGGGTTVSVLLPCTAMQPHLSGDPAPGHAPSTTPATSVLLVDDDRDVRSIMATALRDHGHVVVEAADGQGALAALAAQRFGIAVIDFAMPGMNGAELATRLRTTCPDLPIIFVSGFSDIEAIRSAGQRTSLLHKPFEIDEVLTMIGQMAENPKM